MSRHWRIVQADGWEVGTRESSTWWRRGAPRANASCERFLDNIRRECLDHVLVLHGRHLGRLLREYVDCFNHARPHQGIDQSIPQGPTRETRGANEGTIVSP